MIHRVLPAGRWFEGGAPARRAGGWILALGGLAIVMAGLAFLGKSKVPGGLGTLLLVVVLGAIIIRACLRHPPIAVVFLLGTMFLRLALPHLIVADPFLIAWALVLVSAAGWMWQRRGTLPPVTFVGVGMGLYVLWS